MSETDAALTCAECGCADEEVQMFPADEYFAGGTMHPGVEECRIALRHERDALQSQCAALAGERDELKVQNFALRERTGQLTALEDVHRKRYENLREALGQNIPTGEQIVGASIAAIHERNALRATLDRVRALVYGPGFSMLTLEQVADALRGEQPCEHHRVDIRNEVVLSGSMCTKCGVLFQDNVP